MQTTTTPAHERYIAAARDAGLPRDQVERFINMGYVAWPVFLPFHAAARKADTADGPAMIGLGGARGPGKTHAVLAQIADDCLREPGLKVLFLRKVMKTASESLDDKVSTVLRFTQHRRTADRVEFANDSRVLVGGYKDEREIEKYQGIEYDVIAIEEATQLTEDRVRKLRGSLRTSKPNWRTRMYLTTNPDGIGLQWFKEAFVVPWRNGTQDRTRYFPATWRDNPALKREYINYLAELGDTPLGKAWRDGDWDAFEGMAFPAWNHERHVVEPFRVPEHWPRWRAIDWGYSAPLACLWLAKDPDNGRVVVYRELYQAGLTDREAARTIREMTPPDERIVATYGDPASFWTSRNKDAMIFTPADEYAAEGIYLSKADNSRIAGKRKIDTALGDLPDGEPGLLVTTACANLIRTLPTLPRDKKIPEDVDTDAEDHLYDALRYGYTNTGTIRQRRTDRITRNPFAAVKGL